MTSFVITGNSQTAQTLAAGENGFVGAVGSLYTETATAVSIGSIAGDHGLNVQGTVATATGVAAVRTTNSTSANIDIVVGTQGSITSTATDAIRLSVTNSFTLRNAGLISGQDTGLFVQGVTSGKQFVTIANSGTIEGGDTVIEFGDGVDSVDFRNSGTLLCASGSDRAIDLANGELRLVNTGKIGGDISSDTLFLQNDGTILGRVTARGELGYGMFILNAGIIDSIRCSGTGQITNAGTILSGIDSFFGYDTDIVNLGLIGADVILSFSNDTFTNQGGTVSGRIEGWGGDDTFTIDRGDLRIDGGDGTDAVVSTASYRMGKGIEVLHLEGATGLAGIGREGSETITGGDGNDTLIGRAGNDSLNGGEGDDLLRGGRGYDLVQLSDGTDTLQGGSGIDSLSNAGSFDRASINLATGTAQVTDAGGEVLLSAVASGFENATGGDGDDSLTGSTGANLLQGNLGNDTLVGGGGADTLAGGTGTDSLSGGNGDDVLIGGAGADTLIGGGQADAFQFFAVTDSTLAARDLITDFTAADSIDLSGIDADSVASGDQAFVFVGTAAFAGPGAQVRFVQDAGAGTTTVQVRLANSAVTDMEIVLTGLVNLTAANFDL